VSADFWSVITMGIVILIAIATSNRSLRRDLGERIDGLSKRVNGVQRELADVRERLGRVEGLLEGFGLTWPKEAHKRRSEKHDPIQP